MAQSKPEKKIKELTFGLRLNDLEVVHYIDYKLKKDYDESTYPLIEFGTRFSFDINEEKEEIKCLCNIQVKVIETKELMSELTTSCNFSVTPIKSAVKKNEDGAFDINNFILVNIANVTVSTSRGILFERSKNSVIKDVFPIMDVTQLLNKK